MAKPKTVLVAGAGPGGLVAALALRRQGIEARVFERADREHLCADVGGVYDLSPHTLQALDDVGVGREVRERALKLSEFVTYRDDGAKIGTMKAPVDLDIASLRRSELQRVLVAALGDEALTARAEVGGFDQDEDGVTLQLADGRTARGDVLVGADGVHSAVRRGVLGDRPPRFCDCMCCWGRASVAANADLDALADAKAVSWIGGGAVLVAGRWHDLVVWSAFWHADAYERAPTPEASKAKVTARFAAFAPFARRIIEATDPAVLSEVAIWDRDVDEHWSRGRVALVGDAAHPMTPFLGQGANSAIVDAYVLSHFLAHEGVADAFARYESRRMPGVYKNLASARRICDLMTADAWWSTLACRVLFGWVPDAMMERIVLKADRVNDVRDLVETHAHEPG